MSESPQESVFRTRLIIVGRLLLFVVLVFFFLVAVKLFGESVEMLGGDYTRSLFVGLKNPFAGLAVGILATAMIQSSSATTSIIVAMVGAGQLSLTAAVPMVMGANIGSTITCLIIAFGHVGDKIAFGRAFAGATIHDNFNILTVCLLFPIELVTRQVNGIGFLESWAIYLTGFVSGGGAAAVEGSLGAMNPVDATVTPVADGIANFFMTLPVLEGPWRALPAMLVALVLLIASLIWITKNMKVLMAGKAEEWIQEVLRSRGYIGFIIGLVLTVVVQSSAITTSLLVPMYAAGVLTPYLAFPILVGANIGTTSTALLASAVSSSSLGVTIALVHTLFNLIGTLVFYPIPFMRKIPVAISEFFASLVVKNRLWAIVFVGMVFFVIPMTGIFLWSEPDPETPTEPPAVTAPAEIPAEPHNSPSTNH